MWRTPRRGHQRASCTEERRDPLRSRSPSIREICFRVGRKRRARMGRGLKGAAWAWLVHMYAPPPGRFPSARSSAHRTGASVCTQGAVLSGVWGRAAAPYAKLNESRTLRSKLSVGAPVIPDAELFPSQQRGNAPESAARRGLWGGGVGGPGTSVAPPTKLWFPFR